MTALAHPLTERGDDVYETPEVAVEALLRVEPLPRVLWECAGEGSVGHIWDCMSW